MRRLRSTTRVLQLLVAVLVAVPLFGEAPDEVVRRFIAIAYDGPLDQWPRASEARLERFERQVRNLRRGRCIRVESASIAVVASGPDRITVHADVAIGRSESAVEIVPLRVELTRESARWLVSEVHDRDEERAEQVLGANGEERERLLSEGVSKGLSRALYTRALAYLNNAKWEQAAEVSAMARRVAVEAGDRGGEALAIGAESYTAGLKDPDRAIALSQQSLELAQALGDPEVLARAWYDRGRNVRASRWNRGAAPAIDAAACYRKAVEFAELAGDPALLIRPLYSLANIAANSQADYLAARRLIDRGIAIARETGDAVGEMGFESVLATIYFNQGDHERGLFHNQRAMELAEKHAAYAHASLLVRSAYVLIDIGRFDEARAAYARLLTRDETGSIRTRSRVAGSVLGSAIRALAVIEAEAGNLSEAVCLHGEAAKHHQGGPNAYLFDLAPYQTRNGNDSAALAFALASVSEHGLYANQRVAALVAAGRAYRNLKMVERGLAIAEEAIEIREEVDSRTAGDERQRAFASNATSECYELAAELALDKGDAVLALAFLERGRARVLIDMLDNGRPGAAAEADAELQARLATFDAEVAQIRDELERARVAKSKRLVDGLTDRLTRALAVRASFVDGMQARSERRQGMRRQVGADEILGRAARMPAGAVAVEYFLTDRELHIFVVTRDGRVTPRTKRIERKAVEQSVNEFLEKLAAGDLRVNAAGRKAYEILIAPVETEIAGADALLIVPDELLWSVPFAALVDGRGRFLVERNAIVYAPSISAYAAIAESSNRRGTQPLSLFAVGNPTWDQSASNAAASFYRNATLGPLPDAEHEVEAVGGLYDRSRSLVLKRKQATESRTKTALGDATVAHFATHAILDDANPMYSRLLLARGDGTADDGWLESWEVTRLDLNADLIVLSACETARGGLSGGEGVIGLSWSFLLAGAQSIVATQWKVASHSTAEFMIAFHRSLRAAKAGPALQKAESVRDAQLRLIRDERTRHPFHWAAFVLLGDPAARVTAAAPAAGVRSTGR